MAEMRTRIAQAAFNGELAFYTDAKTKKRSKDKKLHGTSWRAEEEPGGDYDQVDSVMFSPLDPEDIHKWVLYSAKRAQINTWNDVFSVGFIFHYIFEKGKTLTEAKPVIDKDSIICYIKAEDITPCLGQMRECFWISTLRIFRGK